MFFSMECLTIKSFLSPLVPASTTSAFWKAYTLNSNRLGIRYAYNALSAIFRDDVLLFLEENESGGEGVLRHWCSVFFDAFCV